MLDLGRADAERERGKRAVRAGMRVAAHHGHAGQGRALLGPDHVHDALPLVEKREVRLGAERLDVLVQGFDLQRDTWSVIPPMPLSQFRVGVLWSAVAITDSTRHCLRLASLSPS